MDATIVWLVVPYTANKKLQPGNAICSLASD